MHLLLVHEIVCLYLHLFKHGIDIWVIHSELLRYFIFLSQIFINHSLMLLLVVCGFVSLVSARWLDFGLRVS